MTGQGGNTRFCDVIYLVSIRIIQIIILLIEDDDKYVDKHTHIIKTGNRSIQSYKTKKKLFIFFKLNKINLYLIKFDLFK